MTGVQTCGSSDLVSGVETLGSRLVELLLGTDINTEQIGGDLQALLFDLFSSCHISWHCPSATPHGAGRTGMASTRLPDLFLCLLPRPTYSLMPGPWTSLPKLQERVCVCVCVFISEGLKLSFHSRLVTSTVSFSPR